MKKILTYIVIPIILILSYSLFTYRKDVIKPFVNKQIVGNGNTAYATFYDYEPAGTRMIKDSDQIIRSNFMGLRDMLDVEHEVKSSTYSTPDYALPGTYGHHDEGSARITVDTSSPASNEEGRVYVDETTWTPAVAASNGAWTEMTVAEVVTARGSLSTLDARLDIAINDDGTMKAKGEAATLDARLDESLNEDGTLKGTVTMSEWISGYNATQETSTSFNVSGDRRSVYRQGRRIQLICDDTDNNAYVTVDSVSYSSSTTVVCDSSVPSDVNRADYSVVSPRSTPAGAHYGTSAPTSDLINGRLWYDSTNDLLKYYNGSWTTAKTFNRNTVKKQVQSMKPVLDKEPSNTSVGYSAALAFDPDTTQAAQFSFILDNDEWNSTTLTLKTVYSMSLASGNPASAVVFGIDWRAIADTESITGGASGSDSVTWTVGASNTKWRDTTNLTISADSLAAEDLITIEVSRKAGNLADDHNGYLYIHDILITE